MLEHVFMHHSELDLQQDDIFCMSSGDGVCSLSTSGSRYPSTVEPSAECAPGGSKSLTTLHYTDGLTTSVRPLPSDALSLHHWRPDLVFAGLRSSAILLQDLRVKPRIPNVVASMKRGKAVIGVKRLSDSAAPWGLVASAMGDEVSPRTTCSCASLTFLSCCYSMFDLANHRFGSSRGTSINSSHPSLVFRSHQIPL